MSSFQILHISDLHINVEEKFDRSVVLDLLIERVKKDRELRLKPEIVVVTGDVADKGISTEYDLAKNFFDDLLDSMELADEHLFIIPGNHDVNRKRYRPTDIPAYNTIRELNDELENEDFRSDLLKGMNDYFGFIEANYPHLKSIDNRLVPFVNIFSPECGKKVGLVGLNSAWMCRKSPDKEEIAIGEYQLKRAEEALKEQGETDLDIYIFHHPLSWLGSEDRRICQRSFNKKIILNGHLHEEEGGYLEGVEVSFHYFQAGASYHESRWLNSFHYLTLDWESQQIRQNFRIFSSADRKWCEDSMKGEAGKKDFDMIETGKSIPEPSFVTIQEIPTIYSGWIIDNYGYMDADKLYEKGDAFPLSLPEIFIPLKAYEPGVKSIKIDDLSERKEPVDVEDVISISDQILIEGQAGSGKTTLLKHMAYCLSQKDDETSEIGGMQGFLPILISLKDINDFFDRDTKEIKNRKLSTDILEWYLSSRMDGVLFIETVNSFLKSRKTVILLDGLDELSPQNRDPVVNAFSDIGIKYKGNKIVFTSRPHGIEGAAVKRFGNKHIRILPLDMNQVNLFIQKWFAYLYGGGLGKGGKTAQAMISEIKDHAAIKQLIDNPLMLTAICILYHDEKELPGQRAELYKKFVDNLLYRRFPDYEKVHNYLKRLAFKMHTGNVRAIDRSFAVDTLMQVYKKRDEESYEDYREKIEETFDDIEPKCGLLKLEGGQYNFWHLTFQEFLTARYIVDVSRDYTKAIEDYWENDWYREVLELYIGYLSIENMGWASGIIEDVIGVEDQKPYKKWLLASNSLIDIHKDRRVPKVEEKAKKRLLSIIDFAPEPKILVEAGEVFGWLGDTRNLKEFVKIEGGQYNLEDIGENLKIEPFEIGKYPVTNSWFEEFIKADGYKNKDYWSPEGNKWLKRTKEEQPRYWNDRKWKCPNSPVVGVSWYEAYAFTQWLNFSRGDGYEYRLLTEKQWQAAAAGHEGREYAWGNEWGQNNCNNVELNIDKTSPVGIFKQGNTPNGISDLSGNVLEWTLTDYESKEELDDFKLDQKEKENQGPVLRGGSWFVPANSCRCALRLWIIPLDRYDLVGFRCARTVKL